MEEEEASSKKIITKENELRPKDVGQIQLGFYEKHHEEWNEAVERESQKLDAQMEALDDEEEQKANPARTESHQTINMGELYDGMTVQTHQVHTGAFDERVEAMAEAMRKEEDDVEKQ